MYCTTRALKNLLLGINIVCAFIGASLIWYGAWLLKTIEAQPIDHSEDLAAALCILLGVVIILATVFGVVTIFMESKTMLISYAVLLLVLLFIQIILITISYANDNLPKGLMQGFDELWDTKHVGNSTLSRYEDWLQCCGRHSANDYYQVDKVPTKSCCYAHDCTNPLNLHLRGCEEKFRAYVNATTAKFNLISWFLILTEFAASVSACYLVDSIRNHRDRVRFYN